MQYDCQRSEERMELTRSIYFKEDKWRQSFAYTINISPCGTCLLTNRAIEPGETLYLYSRHLWLGPKKARAIWTRVLNDRIRKVGVSICPDLLPRN